MTLIKPAKANWHYLCETCDYTSRRSTDRSGAEYHGIVHERSRGHVGIMLSEAFEPAVEAVTMVANAYVDLARNIVDNVTPVFEALAAAFAPPPNTPHDPTVRANRRAW